LKLSRNFTIEPSLGVVWWLSKYTELASDYIFQPIAVANLDSCDSSSPNLDNNIRTSSGDDKETSFLFQRICSYLTFQFCAFARLFRQ